MCTKRNELHTTVCHIFVLWSQVRRVVDIAGFVDVEFDKLASDLLLTEDYARQVVFDVKVKESDTGRIENNTALYTMFKYRHKLQLVKTAEAFKPGIPYVAYLKVGTFFGQALFLSIKGKCSPFHSHTLTNVTRRHKYSQDKSRLFAIPKVLVSFSKLHFWRKMALLALRWQPQPLKKPKKSKSKGSFFLENDYVKLYQN